MTDEGKSLKELSQRMERLVYIISSTTCPLEPGLGVGASQAALGVSGGTLLPLYPAPVSALPTPLPSPDLLDPCWGKLRAGGAGAVGRMPILPKEGRQVQEVCCPAGPLPGPACTTGS